jgi:hypothetical protein
MAKHQFFGVRIGEENGSAFRPDHIQGRGQRFLNQFIRLNMLEERFGHTAGSIQFPFVLYEPAIHFTSWPFTSFRIKTL